MTVQFSANYILHAGFSSSAALNVTVVTICAAACLREIDCDEYLGYFTSFTVLFRYYAQYKWNKPNTIMTENSQLKYNYVLQPDDVRAANETLNGNVFRGAPCSNDVIVQRA